MCHCMISNCEVSEMPNSIRNIGRPIYLKNANSERKKIEISISFLGHIWSFVYSTFSMKKSILQVVDPPKNAIFAIL